MKILVTGASGLVGSRFVELYPKGEELLTPSHSECDFLDIARVKEYVGRNSLDAVINFAAYTNVSEAENQRGDKKGLCWQINVEGVKNLLSTIDPTKTFFLQISTDMVFSGLAEDPGPYAEKHEAEANEKRLTWYGFTKAEGERFIQQGLGNKAAILRLIYPVRAKFYRKADYLRKPLQLFDQGKLYPLFTDQQVSITFIDEACEAINKVISQRMSGIFHAGSTDTATPYELIFYLLEKARGYHGKLKTDSLDDFLKTVQNPTRYPKFGGLNVKETEKRLGMKFSTWREIIDKLVDQGIAY